MFPELQLKDIASSYENINKSGVKANSIHSQISVRKHKCLLLTQDCKVILNMIHNLQGLLVNNYKLSMKKQLQKQIEMLLWYLIFNSEPWFTGLSLFSEFRRN